MSWREHDHWTDTLSRWDRTKTCWIAPPRRTASSSNTRTSSATCITPRDDVTRALLDALGIAAATDADIERAWAEERAAKASQIIDPVMVVREDAVGDRVSRSASAQRRVHQARNRMGERRTRTSLALGARAGEPGTPRISSDAAPHRETTAVAEAAPGLSPRCASAGSQAPELTTLAEARFIVCPQRAKGVAQRRAGFGVNLYGVRSARNWGCGDFTDLHAIIDAFAPAGAAFIGLNPLHAIANRQPYNTSPYLPECAFYRNFIYLDVERVAGERICQRRLDEDVHRGKFEDLRAAEFVEYERVAELKLARADGAFSKSFPGSREFEHFIAEQGRPLRGLRHLLRAVRTHARAVSRRSGCGRSGRRNIAILARMPWPNSRKAHRKRVRFFQFLQWHLSMQSRGGASVREGEGHGDRDLSRSGARDRSLRLRFVGAPAVLFARLPSGRASRRSRAAGPGLGLSAAGSRRASEGWLSLVRAIDPPGGARRAGHCASIT